MPIDFTRGRMLSYQLKDPSGHADAVDRINQAFRATYGNAVRAAEHLTVSHRALMEWVATYPDLRKKLDEARGHRAKKAAKRAKPRSK